MNQKEFKKSIGDLINEAKQAVFVQSIVTQLTTSKPVVWEFVNKMPSGSILYDVQEGYLLYHLESELFAGQGNWGKHIRNLLFLDEVEYALDDFNLNDILSTGKGEVVVSKLVLVPCKSHEAKLEDKLYILQEFDWRGTLRIENRDGKFSVIGG